MSFLTRRKVKHVPIFIMTDFRHTTKAQQHVSFISSVSRSVHRQAFVICTSHIFCYTAEMCSCSSAPTFCFKVLCVEIFPTFFKGSSLSLVKWLIRKGTYCQASLGFALQDSSDGRTELTPTSCPLISSHALCTCARWYPCPSRLPTTLPHTHK